MTPPLVVGIDPGGRWTGLVARRGDELLDHAVLENPASDDPMVSSGFLVAVVGWVGHWVDEMDADIVAIERAKKPSSHIDGKVSIIAPESLIGLGMVCGAVLAYFPDAVVVDQSGYAPLFAYPKALVGARETTGTGGRLRHSRSAWDVAGRAPAVRRLLQAVR